MDFQCISKSTQLFTPLLSISSLITIPTLSNLLFHFNPLLLLFSHGTEYYFLLSVLPLSSLLLDWCTTYMDTSFCLKHICTMFLGQIQDTTFLCIFINYICRLLKYPYYLFYFFFFSFIFIFLAILFQFQIFDYSYIQSLLAFLPQFILLVSLTVKYYKQIELCLFLQTLVFVAFNKVYTKELTPYYILVSFHFSFF